jgi:basic amino acid/polyamine antiporter, APA family
VRDPERTLPRATIYGTLAATLLYLIATISIFGMIPAHKLATSNSPFADAANIIFGGSWGGKAIALVAMISTFGALNGWTLLQGRVPLAAAEDGLFPRRFARVNGRSGTPVFGLVVSSLLVTVLLLLYLRSSLVNTFYNLILLATLTTLVPYAYSAAAELYLLFKERELFSGTRLARDAVIALLAFAYSAWAIWGAGEKTIAWGFMLLLGGIPVFIWLKWRQGLESSATTIESPALQSAASSPAPQLAGAVD